MAREEEVGKDQEERETSIEEIFESKPVPSWTKQLTVRAFVVSFVLGVFFSFIVMKLNLTTGIIPSLNVAAGLLGFFFVKIWTTLLEKSGLLRQPFTRQENTVIQTCVVACSGLSFSGGFGSYILGMSEKIAKQSEGVYTANNVKDPHLGWLIGFMFAVSFVGLFSIVALRKIMILKYRLTYPSGTATALLINSFHTPAGAKLAKKQVKILFNTFSGSFIWAFFQWFFTGGDECGFSSFPTFGLQAYANRFYFDFSATYVGVGMICPYIINISLLLGAVLSWGIMWPLIEKKKGDWYSTELPGSSLHGLQGYKIFISIAFILGDGLYHFAAVVVKSVLDISRRSAARRNVTPFAGHDSPDGKPLSYDDQKRAEVFLKGQIPNWIAGAGYVALAAVSIVAIPVIFPQLEWYHVLITYLVAPVLAFCNSYGCGLTDWSLASSYGKLAIFVFGAWVGGSNGGVMAGLAACGVMMGIVSTASDLMQDFKTGYLTLASPRSMFVSQVIGTAMGCVIAPGVFWVFYRAFPLGEEGSAYPAPYAFVYRGIALLGVEGFASLPKHCLSLCLGFFLLSVAMNLTRDVLKWRGLKAYKVVPSAMAMAIPFYLGSYFTIDMCLGSLILFVWQRTNKKHADAFAPAVASGMICGDGIWSLPASILALFKVQPPVCMKFLSRSDNKRVDAFLNPA